MKSSSKQNAPNEDPADHAVQQQMQRQQQPRGSVLRAPKSSLKKFRSDLHSKLQKQAESSGTENVVNDDFDPNEDDENARLRFYQRILQIGMCCDLQMFPFVLCGVLIR